MFTFRRLAVAITACLVLTAGASTANALRMTISPFRAITIRSLGNISFRMGETTIECPVTINAELVEGVNSPTRGTNIGRTNSVLVHEEIPCSEETVSTSLNSTNSLVFRELLTVRGEGIEDVIGILFLIENFKVSLTSLGGLVRCLYHGDVSALLAMTRVATGRYLSNLLRLLGRDTLELEAGSNILCARNKTISGSFSWPETSITKTAR